MLLHWSGTSPFVRKVMIAAHELGVADRLTLRETFPETVVDDVRGDNPLAQIPTLVLDDGTVLYDSLVIALYLNDIAGGTLFGATDDRYSVLTRHALAAGMMERLNARTNELNRPEPDRSPRVTGRFADSCTRVYDAFDRIAATFPQDNPDFGHITIAAALGYADYRLEGDGWRAGRPALEDWFKAFSERPSFQATRPPPR